MRYCCYLNFFQAQVYVVMFTCIVERLFTICDQSSVFDHTLQQILLSPAARYQILSDVASGLAYIHSNNFIHRDLKVNLYYINLTRICYEMLELYRVLYSKF